MSKILRSLKGGFLRSTGLWIGVMIIWFITLILSSLVANPMRASMTNALHGSMVTEKLKSGISIDVLGDMGRSYYDLLSYFSSGILMLILAGIITNSFFSGGLFSGLRANSNKLTASQFFRDASRNFFRFLSISLLMSAIIFVFAILIVILPAAAIIHTEGISDYIIVTSGIILTSIFLFILIINLLVSDYARAWIIDKDGNQCFKAIAFGYLRTFRTFYSSYPMMLLIMIVQFLYLWLVLKIIPSFKPSTFPGLAGLFLLSQLLFIIRLQLKTWRYGSVMVMMEM